ncbi:MAG: HTH domain-containing protein [Chloroflexia bacterium]|nr:HTH domain-containing protein [Chloroflexia bacterium]
MTSSVPAFYLLGELSVEWPGPQVDLPPLRTQGLLAALLLYPGPLRRECLLGLLFPEMAEEVGRKRLSQLLWLLRRDLPDLALESSPQEIHLPAESRWLDVEAFRQAAQSSAAPDWIAGLALYRGDLLPGVPDEWLVAERETLYLQQVHLLQRLGQALLQQEQFERALPYAERLARLEPYDEPALRTLMRAYQALGRRGAALAAHERFVALAAGELGVEPDPATQSLAEAIRRTSVASLFSVAAEVPLEGSPQDVLRQGQEFLERADLPAVARCLEHLQRHPDPIVDYARLLEIDRALFFERYEQAAQLLADCPLQAPCLVRRARLALERREMEGAHEGATQALLQAHQDGDWPTELRALLILARTYRNYQGEMARSFGSAAQALNLARAYGSPLDITRALVVSGRSAYPMPQAIAHFQEARTRAIEHGFRRQLAEALHGIANVQDNRGELRAALRTRQEELALWRDLGLQQQEAAALHNLAVTYDELGQAADSLRALEQARAICRELGDPVRIAINTYHWGAALLYHDDAQAPQAVAALEEAVRVLQEQRFQLWEAAAWHFLGYARWVDGQYQAALDALLKSYALHEVLGELDYQPEMLAYQGLACLGLGQYNRALEYTQRALGAMIETETSSEVAVEVYYAHAMVLDGLGQEDKVSVYLRRALDFLLAQAAQCEDEAARQAMFRRNPTTRRLMQELYARGLAPASGQLYRRLPAAGGDQSIRVAWTVDAGPPDAALKQAQGAIGLRRARLLRLLHEAQAQGAAPTVSHLAETLGVSPRTIHRDLSALREAGQIE